jgi:hypothetical protein
MFRSVRTANVIMGFVWPKMRKIEIVIACCVPAPPELFLDNYERVQPPTSCCHLSDGWQLTLFQNNVCVALCSRMCTVSRPHTPSKTVHEQTRTVYARAWTVPTCARCNFSIFTRRNGVSKCVKMMSCTQCFVCNNNSFLSRSGRYGSGEIDF